MGIFLSALILAGALLVAGAVWVMVEWATRRKLWRPWFLLVLCPLLAFWPIVLAKLSR